MRRWIALAARLYPRSWRSRYGAEFDALVEDAAADWRQLLNVLGGALSMQLANYQSYLKAGGATALAGAILAIALSYRVPPRYVSSAVLLITPVVDAGKATAPEVLQRAAEDRIESLWAGLTGRDNLLQLAQDPELRLYDAEHQQSTWEDVAEQVSHDHDFQILPVKLPGRTVTAFRVSFAYRDREKAHAALDRMIGELRKMNDQANQTSAVNWKMLWSESIPFSDRLDLVEPASVPSSLARPRRSIFLMCGAAGGLLLGLVAMSFLRHPKAGLKIAACGVAGCALAGGLSLLISEQYTSRAQLRISAPFDPQQVSGAVAATPASEWVQRLRREVLDSDNVYSILRMPKLGFDEATAAALYKDRERAFGIRMLHPGSDIGAGSSFEITFSDSDPFRARAVVLELVSQMQVRYQADLTSMDERADEQVRQAHLHHAGGGVVTTATPITPDEPTTHYRLQLMAAGAAMGLLLAVARWSGGTARTNYRTSINGESSLSL